MQKLTQRRKPPWLREYGNTGGGDVCRSFPSLQIWRCGGSITIDPCSRVGHVFRKKMPHKWKGKLEEGSKTVRVNALRTIEIWADQWKEFYYQIKPSEPMLYVCWCSS